MWKNSTNVDLIIFILLDKEFSEYENKEIDFQKF